LRWPHELAESPSVFATSRQVRYLNVPLMDNAPNPRGVAATYRHILDTRATELAVVARALLEPEGLPAVIGCAAGVDRTGVTIALLLSAVGVPADVVAGDYAQSAVHYAGDGKASGLDDWRGNEVTLDCRPEYMLESLDHLERKHGGARSLLARRGLSAAELDGLTELLTEPAAAVDHPVSAA
jgi:Tyrosine phosphatase family